jgi:TPR repeat protein
MQCDEPAEERLRQPLALLRETRDRDALDVLVPLAEAGGAQAQLLLGWTYQVGRGHAVDAAMAERWYAAAAEQEYPAAHFYLAALRAASGRDEEARALFERAAEQGFAPAWYRLALLDLKHQGSERRAISRLRLARERGHLPSAIRLARLALRGRCGVREWSRALIALPFLALAVVQLASREPDDERLLR